MPLWNPNAKIPTNLIPTTTTTTTVTTNNNHVAEPFRDAARMAALKRLRHTLVSLSSSSSSSSSGKVPVLTFERWLARFALRRDQAMKKARRSSSSTTTIIDPIIPSDGILDEGLVKDLARCLSYDLAQSIATTMATDGKVAAEKVATITKSKNSQQQGNQQQQQLKDIQTTMKDSVKAVKKAAKLVQKSLKKVMTQTTTTNEDDEDEDEDEDKDKKKKQNDLSLESSLVSLRTATEVLDTCTQNVQRISGYGPDVTISGSRRIGIFDVALLDPTTGNAKKPYLTISTLHLTKLVQLWTMTQQQQQQNHKDDDKNNNSSDDSDDDDKDETKKKKNLSKNTNNGNNNNNKKSVLDPLSIIEKLPDKSQFLKSVYCLLARYDALKGAGYQCAIPGIAFDAISSSSSSSSSSDDDGLLLGTTIECFASPLNCHYQRYCSLFPDLECSFGSYGSFFDDTSFFPLQGSYEANPPFVPETMIEMGIKIEKLLNNPNANELSFLIIVPAWGAGISFCENLESSIHMRATTRIVASEHAYCDGAQHNRPTVVGALSVGGTKMKKNNHHHNSPKDDAELRPSSWDTAVILLQNDAGAKKWPVTTEVLESTFCAALREAASTMPSNSATIDQWERRGVARGGRKIVPTTGTTTGDDYQSNKRARSSY